MRKILDAHALVHVEVKSPYSAVYLCLCGKDGVASIGYFTTTPRDVEKAAKTNHGLHQTRAVMKELLKVA